MSEWMEDNSLLRNISGEDMEKIRLLKSVFSGFELDESSITIEEFYKEFMSYSKFNHSKSYQTSIKITFDYLIKYYPSGMGLMKISVKSAEKFIQHLSLRAPKGYRVYYRNLKAAFNKAVLWDYLRMNPFTKIKLSKRQSLTPEYISTLELDKICNYLNDSGKGKLSEIVTFAFYTGMRACEIVNLKWENVDMREKLITVGDKEFKTKTRKQRIVPMTKEIFELMSKRVDGLKGSGYVYCKVNRKPYTVDHISKQFKRACKECGISEGIHFHSLRHSAASYLLKNGVGIYLVKEILGHSSVKVTEIYTHVSLEDLREAVGKL